MQQTKKKADSIQQNNVIPFIPEGDFYFTKGVEAFQKRKFDIAIKWLKKAIDEAPHDPLYQCQMSIIYTEVGAYNKANQLLTDVVESSGDKYVDCYYLLANNYAHLGLLNDAKKYAHAYLDKEPNGNFTDDADHLLYMLENDEDEDEDWDLADEDELLVYRETVFYYMEHMEWEKALPLLEEMLVLFPDHSLTKHDYTQALFYSGSKKKAVQMEKAELEKDPHSLFSHANLAVFYYELNETEAYEKHTQTLLNVYPIHEQQKLRVAISLAKTQKFQEAYRRFRVLSKGLIKSHPSYYRWFSLTAYEIGNPERACTLWKEGCKRHPNLSDEEMPWR